MHLFAVRVDTAEPAYDGYENVVISLSYATAHQLRCRLF